MFQPIMIGCVIPQRSGVAIVPSIWHLWSPSPLLMVKMRRRTVMLSQASSQTPWRSPLTLTSDMITYSIMRRDMNYHKKEDKIEFDLEYFNKITKGGLPNKTLTLLSLALVSARVCLCVMLPPHSWEGKRTIHHA